MPQKRSRTRTVSVPEPFSELFEKAEQSVSEYFKSLSMDPTRGTIEINGQRYVLVRASALSLEFLESIQRFYADRGTEEAMLIGKNMLFDMAHMIGMQDAKNFHEKMNLHDPIAKLSAGPVHFAHTGWAFVDILEESKPSPDKNYFLKYHHPYSFEADSWLRAGKKSDQPVCVMNAGYSSGWCEASFGISLTAVEINCKAKGDEHCTFIMAPPDQIGKYVKKEKLLQKKIKPKIPFFLERKKIEEQVKRSLVEKEVLLKEIHHRVKNNLQIISSLLNLQSHTVKDKKTKSQFNESIRRIRSIAVVHELLYKSADLMHISMHDYFESLVSEISSNFSPGGKKVSIHTDVNIKDDALELDKAIPCGLILNELLTNALKHAFRGKKSGKINVSIHHEKNEFVLCVKDNGVGINVTSFIKTDRSLGSQLVQSLVEQLDGKLEIKSNKGTYFEIRFR